MKTAKKLCVGYRSACEYWALPSSRGAVKRSPTMRNVKGATANIGALRDGRLHEPWLAELTPPVHLLVPGASSVRPSSEIACHVMTLDMPSGSFVPVGHGVCVVSPELCALQAATFMEHLELVRYLSTLCAAFGVDNESGDIVPGEPPTSSQLLARYVQRLPGRAAGAQRLKQVLPFVVDRAASPPEIAVALLLSLPMRWGGYGLPKPVLNWRVDPQGLAKRSSEKAFYVLDVAWPQFRLGVEYDSTQYHTQEERIAEDAKRRVAVAAAGIELVTLTRPQLYSSDAFNQVAHLLASRMGRRLRFRGQDFAQARTRLRETMLFSSW